MLGSRSLTAIVGLVASLAVSTLVWWYVDTLALFLVVPFVPFLFSGDRDAEQVCPQCGFRTTAGEYAYCPRDGTPLEP